MSEFGDIFAGDLSTAVFIYGTVFMASIAAAVILWMTRARHKGPNPVPATAALVLSIPRRPLT
jgi:hypothetical protein